jgi:hypothetical protein
MQLRIYYLRDENGRRIFYGSAGNMTEIMNLRDQLSRLGSGRA